jgi:hypothetical protein
MIMRLLHPDTPWIGDDEVADDEAVIATTRAELALLANSIGDNAGMVDAEEPGVLQ